MADTRTRYDWDQAFKAWVEMGTERSLTQLAVRMGCRKSSIMKAAKRLRWQERLETIERKANERVDEKLIRARAERVDDTIRIIDAARTRFAGQLARSDFRLTGSDFVGLIKLEALLEGEATDRVAIGDVRVLIDAVLVVARRFVDDPSGTVDERRGRFLAEVKQLPVPGIERGEQAA